MFTVLEGCGAYGSPQDASQEGRKASGEGLTPMGGCLYVALREGGSGR